MSERIAELLGLIGFQLRRKREGLHITQDAVASDAGIPLASYQEMETAKRQYRIDTFLRVLDVFQFDIMRALDTPQPKRRKPKQEVLHAKLDDLLNASDPWPTVAETNVEAVWLKWKHEQR